MYSTYIQRIEIALLSDPWCIQLTLNTDSRHSNTDKYSLTICTYKLYRYTNEDIVEKNKKINCEILYIVTCNFTPKYVNVIIFFNFAHVLLFVFGSFEVSSRDLHPFHDHCWLWQDILTWSHSQDDHFWRKSKRNSIKIQFSVVNLIKLIWGSTFLLDIQCWGKLLLKVMHYNIALLPKKVTNYVT